MCSALKAVRVNDYVTIFFKASFYPETGPCTLKRIVKSILRCRKTITLPKNYFWEKQLCRKWSHAIAHTARGDNNNNNTHLFFILSLNKFKNFLLNFVIKHMVNDSPCTAEPWRHGRETSKLTKTRGIVYRRHQRAQWEFVARSRYWIWLGEFSNYVINSDSKHCCIKGLY